MKSLNQLNTEILEHLIFNYGSEYKEIFKYIDENNDFGQTILGTSQYLKAEVMHAVREEMEINSDDTNRVFYVGVTRAKKSLHVVKSEYGGFIIWTKKKYLKKLLN